MDDITKPMDMEKYYKKVVEHLLKNPLSLKEEKNIISNLAKNRPDLFMEFVTGTMDEQIITFLKQGQKILAIKWYRSETNEGLKDAKDYVEYVQRQYNL